MKWEIVLRELPNHLQHNYIDFKKNWDFHLKENVPAPFDPERELAFMKQLLRAELPQLEVARSAEEVWKILDFIYDHQVVLGNSSLLRNFWSQKADEKDTLTVTVFSILSGGVPNETSKVRLSNAKTFQEQKFPCLRRCKKVDCDHQYVLLFDEMIVEEDATPIGLGIKDGDILAWIPRFNIQNTDETNEIVRNFGGPALLETIRYKTMRNEEQVSGQNIFLRGEDGGHLLPQFKEPPKTVSKSNTLADLENMSLKDEQVQYIDETAEMTVYVGPRYL